MKKPKCILALSIRDQKTLFLTCSHLICFGSPCKLFKNSRRSKVLTRYTNETFIANGFTWFEFLNDFKWTFWSHILSNLGNELTILQKVKIHYNFEIIFSKLKSLVPVRFYSYDFWRRMFYARNTKNEYFHTINQKYIYLLPNPIIHQLKNVIENMNIT